MEQKLEELIIEIAADEGWTVDIYEINEKVENVCFQRYSPSGQDFSFQVEIKDNNPMSLIKEMADYYDDFNPDREALQWYDEKGHGTNGAPKRLKDIIIDFEKIEEAIYQLQLIYQRRKKELEQAAIHKVKVQVTETMQKIVEVDAINDEDACDKVEEMVNGSEIILTGDDFVGREIEPYGKND